MPYTSPHMLLQWGGTFANAAGATAMDEFAGTLRFTGPGLDAVDNQDACDAVGETLRSWWESASNGIPTIARLGWAKWNRIGVDGRYSSSSRTLISYLTPTAQGGNSTIYPLQIACVTTWTTSLARGRASKGRTYWPTAMSVSSSSNARLSTAQQTTMAGAARDLIVGLNATVQAEGGGIVASVMSDLGGGTSSPITGVRVGNRLDIQRRRDNSVPEVYVTQSFSGA